MNRDIAAMRQSYQKASLDVQDLSEDPIQAFKIWFAEAKKAEIEEPNAMVLATADASGIPSARVVLLKGLDERGFHFYTNYESQKGQELIENPQASIVFFWQPLERQVRISGKVVKMSKEESRAYFRSRPLESQLGAWTSPQSQIIEDRNFLEDRFDHYKEKFSEVEEIPLPENWGGFLVNPYIVEFWQGRPSRLHDRLRYTKNGKVWMIDRLAP